LGKIQDCYSLKKEGETIMKKLKTLKDGTEVIIRPLTDNDVEKSFQFFQALPPEDREYLRVDVTQKDLVEKRIKTMKEKSVKRIAALHNGRIVADAALELEGVGWKEGTAELRIIIAQQFQRKGLGVIMAGELYLLAQKEKVEELVVKMMKPQLAAQSIFHKLGFHHDTTLSNYVKDLHGHKQDLVILRCSLIELWQELEDYFYEKDMRHAVTHMF
jgi:ribosomal protein S18 acetylase RimI-like enzyme